MIATLASCGSLWNIVSGNRLTHTCSLVPYCHLYNIAYFFDHAKIVYCHQIIIWKSAGSYKTVAVFMVWHVARDETQF